MKLIILTVVLLSTFPIYANEKVFIFDDNEIVQKKLVEQGLKAVSNARETRLKIASELAGRNVASQPADITDHENFIKSLESNDEVDWFSKIDKEIESSN